jgi:hypothetical protein
MIFKFFCFLYFVENQQKLICLFFLLNLARYYFLRKFYPKGLEIKTEEVCHNFTCDFSHEVITKTKEKLLGRKF